MDAQLLIARDTIRLAAEKAFFWAAVYAYGAAFVFYVLHFAAPRVRAFRSGSTAALVVAAVFQTVMIVLRTVVKGAPPFQSLYESLAWFAWSTVIAYLVIEWRRSVKLPGFFVSLVAGGACLYALLGQSPEIKPLFPALQSTWFFWHVAIAFGSYAVFVVAFGVEVSYLLQLLMWKLGSKRDYGLTRENIARFHRSVHQLVIFAFPMLTFGIMSGAAWANEAWGVYWQWDPKETWSLITWFVFALYLHTRVRPTWRGAPSSVIMILAFLCMVTTFLGVSWLAKLFGIPSLHLYSG
ncbi:MAG: c-type cytochrome biogenesis protein CcsB [Candidatus Eisenbacteria bacterium]